MLRRSFLVAFLSLAAAPVLAQSESLSERVVRELRADGFTDIRVSRTLLGRLRFVAVGPPGRREIVINPVNGWILRDYFELGDDDDDDDRWDGRGEYDDDDDDDDDDEGDDDDEDDDDDDDESDDD